MRSPTHVEMMLPGCPRFHALLPLAAACASMSLVRADENLLPPLLVKSSHLPEKEERVTVPGSSVVIPRELIEASAAGSVAELLEVEAGLPFSSFYGGSGLGAPILRGFAENSSSRTLILVDGLPVNRSDLAAAPWLQFPLGGLERISLLRGSRTVRYGSAALGGVIALESRRGDGQMGGSWESTWGSDGLERHRGAFHTPVGDWELALRGEDDKSEGYRQNGGYESTSWQIRLASPEGRSWQGQWSVSGNDLLFENPGSLSQSEFFADPRQSRNVRFGQADQFFNDVESVRASQNLRWELGGERDLSVDGAWFQRERQTNFGPGSHSDNDLESWTVESVLSGERGALTWEIGLRASRDDLALTRFTEIERMTSLGDARLRRELFGGFGLAQYDLGAGWVVSGGAGWESYELQGRADDVLAPLDPALNFSGARRDDGFAGELALEYESVSGWNAWFRYDRVYRFPVVDEIAAYQGFLLTEPFNATLDPERGHALEIGIGSRCRGWSGELTVFSQWLDGEIAYDFLANNNVNFADTHRLGLEASARWESENWSARLQYGATRAEYAAGMFEGRRVPLVPEHAASAVVAWTPRDDLSLSLEGRYVGKSPEGNDFENSANPLPSYTVFNARVQWEAKEDLFLFVRSNNLLDRRYASLKFQEQWYPAAGRQILAGARWEF